MACFFQFGWFGATPIHSRVHQLSRLHQQIMVSAHMGWAHQDTAQMLTHQSLEFYNMFLKKELKGAPFS